MAFNTNSSTIGVNLNTPTTTADFALGSIVYGSDGSIWQYAVAATTVSAYAVVAINASGSMNMAVLGHINGTSGVQLAVAQNSFAPSEYGWVPIHGTGGDTGTFKVKTSGSVSTGLVLYLGTASGNIAITAAASATLEGIAFVTGLDTANTAVTSQNCILTWPRPKTTGS